MEHIRPRPELSGNFMKIPMKISGLENAQQQGYQSKLTARAF